MGVPWHACRQGGTDVEVKGHYADCKRTLKHLKGTREVLHSLITHQ